MTPGISLLAESKAPAVNCCAASASMEVDGGSTPIRAIVGAQTGNNIPFSCVPGLNARPPLPPAKRCCMKLPVLSGERVNDWLLSALRCVDPPYETRLAITLAGSRKVMTPAELIKVNSPDDAV